MDYTKLREPFAPELISWRVGARNKEQTSAIALAYIDARDVRQRLNDVCGVGGWSSEHYDCGGGKLGCKLSVKIDGEWVSKTDGAGATDVEADKGAFSDSLKRAAVSWGVGEYLYDVKNTWVDIVPYGRSSKIKNPNDPTLAKALQDAANGIRMPIEDEPYVSPPQEAQIINDICHLVRCCQSEQDMNDTFEEYQVEMGEFGDVSCHDDINATAAEMKTVWAAGNQAQNIKYAFVNVKHACEEYVAMRAFVEGCDNPILLEAWYDKWHYKSLALMIALKADKYKRDGLSPYNTLINLYNEKIEELS